MVFFWIAVVVVIVLLVSSLTKGRDERGTKKEPLEILKERYAKGEISTQEYEERKKTLTGSV